MFNGLLIDISREHQTLIHMHTSMKFTNSILSRYKTNLGTTFLTIKLCSDALGHVHMLQQLNS